MPQTRRPAPAWEPAGAATARPGAPAVPRPGAPARPRRGLAPRRCPDPARPSPVRDYMKRSGFLAQLLSPPVQGAHIQVSKCRCGPVALPVIPTLPMCMPAGTISPTLT
jgi:hypothetical protein